LTAKRNWAAKKAQKSEAKERAKAQARKAADAEYKRHKDGGELTWESRELDRLDPTEHIYTTFLWHRAGNMDQGHRLPHIRIDHQYV
jgi:hypothetical protein